MLKTYLLLILFFPLIGFIINGFFYKSLSKNISNSIGCVSIFLSFIFSLFSIKFFNTQSNPYLQIDYFSFLSIAKLNINFSLIIDKLNLIYLLVITFIGLLIHIYSVAYMHDDKAQGKFFSYLNLFIFSMLLLVLGANYLILFIGWEGVGLCSFLLIGFWNENKEYTYAARKAFIMNRIGDLFFLIAMFLFLSYFKTLDINTIKEQGISQLSPHTQNIIALCLFLAATGKSAQLPLYTWLPDAMAGPTPVSALIHAATMVTAGIFLISKTYFLFYATPQIQTIILYIGLVTALVAASIATMQNDIKKILAYSTVSQLGFMFMSLGVGNYEGAIFHVITHAFFKALLFLGAGSVIHAMHGEQNIFKMGGLKVQLKTTHITFLIACLAISGIPGLAGFFSKDNILISIYQHNNVIYFIALAIALTTVYYMFRLYYLVFHGNFRGSDHQKKHLHESPKLMTIPLIVLAFFSIIIGYINIPHLLGGHAALSHFLSTQIRILTLTVAPQQEIILMLVTILLITCVWMITKKKFNNIENEKPLKGFIQKLFSNKWYIDELYHSTIVLSVNKVGTFFKHIIEIQIIDKMIDNIGVLVIWLSQKVRLLQTGKIGAYSFWMLIGIIILLAILIL